jgi:hypothetical protein
MKIKNLSVFLVAIAIFLAGIVFVIQVRQQPTVSEISTDKASRSASSQVAPSFDVDTLVRRLQNQFIEVDGALVTHNSQRRAEFSSQGLRYFTKEAGGMVGDQVFEYRLAEMRAGEQTYPVRSVAPEIAGDTRIEYERGFGLVEAYLALDQGVEQVFELATPLEHGDLTLVGRVGTNLQVAVAPSGELRFLSGGKDVLRYGVAVVFDAQGRHLPVTPQLSNRPGADGWQLSLTVPGDWLAEAAYPVTVDPFIGGDFLISVAEDDQRKAALAYNDDRDEWLVVWVDARDGDGDINAQIVNNSGRTVGDVILLADDDDTLTLPAAAYDSNQKRYLVVWQNDTQHAITGRVLNAIGGFLTDAFYINKGTLFRHHPAVAYNPVSDEYLVVWARDAGDGTGNIWGRKVGDDGTPDPGGPFLVSDLANDEAYPSLVAYPESSGGQYLVVWERQIGANRNILGVRLDSDGTQIANIFRISSTGAVRVTARLALDTTNDQVLVAWTVVDGVNSDVYGRFVNSDGSSDAEEFAISENPSPEDLPDVTYNSTDQEFLAIWNAAGYLYGQRYGADTSPIGDVITLTQAENTQYRGRVLYGNDQYLAAWEDTRNDHYDIMGGRFNNLVELVGNEIVLPPAYDDQNDPALAFGTQQEEWLVVWYDERHDDNDDIYGQFVTRDGSLNGEPIPICTDSAKQRYPDVAYNPLDDQFLVVWDDNRNNTSDIYGQRVDATDGSLLGEIQVTTDASSQSWPAVAADDKTGQFLVVWMDLRGGGGSDIYGRRISPDGTFSDSFILEISTNASSQDVPDVAFNPVTNEYLVVWEDDSMFAGGMTGIAGQRVANTTIWKRGANFDIGIGSNWLEYPSVTCNTMDGEYLVVWEDRTDSDRSDIDIYGRLVGGSGELLGDGEIAISTHEFFKYKPQVSYGPVSQWYYVVWVDGRNALTDFDIYGQALSASGKLLFTDAETNAPAFVYFEEQYDPMAAADPQDDRVLLVWQDRRSGAGADVYGRFGEPSYINLYLPLVVQGGQ